MANPADAVMNLPEFRNESYTDFTQPANRKRMEEALAKVRGQLGREYDIIIGGERVRTPDKLISVNPARPDEIVGIHQKATPELANRAIETAQRNFAGWSRTPDRERIWMLVKVASLIRERKYGEGFVDRMGTELDTNWKIAEAVLAPQDEAKFDAVTYTYYEQLNGYEHLKRLDIGYYFYSGSYADDILKVLDLVMGLRVPVEIEREGLDLALHGEVVQ